MSGTTLTHAQAVNRLKDITEEVQRLRDKKDKTAEDDSKVGPLLEEFRSVDRHRKDLEHDAALAEIREAAKVGKVEGPGDGVRSDTDPAADPAPRGTVRDTNVGSGQSRTRYRNPWELSEVRSFGRDPADVAGELRSRALDAIERMPHAPDKVREASAKLIEDFDDTSSRMAQLLLATSSPTYMRAFTKLMRAQGQVATLDAEERDAYVRAMSLTDTAGGFLVPFQLDPTVILTANGSRNRIRQISRVVTATGDVWNGISSAGVTGSWDAEAAEVSDDAPTIAQPSIPVYKGAIFVPISLEARQDEANVAQEVARMIAFEKDRMESVAFVTGSGSGEPTGIITALTGTGSVINSATTDTFAVADVYNLDGDLPARYADNATWVAHRKIYNLIRRFDTSGGAGLWTTLGNGLPAQLLDRPNVTAEAMDSTITALAPNPVLVYGDFDNYVIADRIGLTVEYIPHLFGANRRPTGQSGWYAHFRVGADSVNDSAFRMLDVT
jgi:HK97 family phage major capsid protein